MIDKIDIFKNPPCFYIGEKTLYMYVRLLEYNNFPIFFVCLDKEKQKYLVVCTNFDELTYIVVKIENNTLRDLMLQKIDMRSPFETSERFWEIKAGYTPEEDTVVFKDVTDLPVDDLPYKGSKCYALYTEYSETNFLDLLKELKLDEDDYKRIAPRNEEACVNGLLQILDSDKDADLDILMSEYFSSDTK